MESILMGHKAGDKISIKYFHLDKPVETYIVLKQNPSLRIFEGNTPGTASAKLKSRWMTNAN